MNPSFFENWSGRKEIIPDQGGSYSTSSTSEQISLDWMKLGGGGGTMKTTILRLFQPIG